jgi:hypothetical protein
MTALRLVLINRFFPDLGLNEKSTANEFTASFARDTNWKTICFSPGDVVPKKAFIFFPLGCRKIFTFDIIPKRL